MNLDPAQLWIFTERHLDSILTYGLPFLFLAGDTIMKWSTGQKDFSSLGADASLSGVALYVGTFLALIAKQVLPGTAAASAVILLFPSLLAWFFCLKLIEGHRKGRTGDMLVKPDLPSFILGVLVVSFCWNGSRYLLSHFNFPV
jgi:hypothetical protein